MIARDKCPAHYCFSDLQPWDVIDAWGLDYYLGNVLKYICRAGRKSPDVLVDLNKALHYLQKEVELEEAELERSSRFPPSKPEGEVLCPSCNNEMEFRTWGYFGTAVFREYLCPKCWAMRHVYDHDEEESQND